MGVIVERPSHRLADRLEAGEVDHRLDSVLAQDFGQPGRIAHIAFHLRHRLAQNPRQPVADLGAAVAVVVQQHDPMPGLGQRHHRMTANVTGPTGQQDVHIALARVVPPRLIRRGCPRTL